MKHFSLYFSLYEQKREIFFYYNHFFSIFMSVKHKGREYKREKTTRNAIWWSFKRWNKLKNIFFTFSFELNLLCIVKRYVCLLPLTCSVFMCLSICDTYCTLFAFEIFHDVILTPLAVLMFSTLTSSFFFPSPTPFIYRLLCSFFS